MVWQPLEPFGIIPAIARITASCAFERSVGIGRQECLLTTGSMSGVWQRAKVGPVRHATKGAATDMFGLPPPHARLYHQAAVVKISHQGRCPHSGGSLNPRPEYTAQLWQNDFLQE